MTDVPHNANDPEFLLSRSLDEELTREEQKILDAALAESAALRAEAERLGLLNRLLARWASSEMGVDWEGHRSRIAGALGGMAAGSRNLAEEEGLEAIDRLIARWAQREPQVDWDRFSAEVAERIEPSAGATTWQRWLGRVVVPLAAAAAIVFAATLGPWRGSGTQVVSIVKYEHDRQVVSEVSFSRGTASRFEQVEVKRGVGFSIISVGEMTADWNEPPPS